MTVVARNGPLGTTYRIRFTFQGERVVERVGRDRREAERLLAQRRREVKQGTYRREAETSATSVGAFAQSWLAARTGRNAHNEASAIKRLVLSRPWLARMPLGMLRPKHAAQLVAELRQTNGATGKPLSDKTCKNVFATFRTMCRDAQMRELIPCDPCLLPRGTFRRKSVSVRTIYPRDEIARLSHDERVLPVMRMFALLAFYTGARKGEICGFRWSDIDPGPSPLTSLTVARQYEGAVLKTERAAGEHTRKVPIHSELAAALNEWRTVGYELHCGKRPQDDAPIIPTRDGTHHSRTSIYLAWRTACVRCEVANRSVHSTRHTFITMARRAGARTEVVEKITHNAKGEVIDDYTHWEWAPLCEAVSCLSLGPETCRKPASGSASGSADR